MNKTGNKDVDEFAEWQKEQKKKRSDRLSKKKKHDKKWKKKQEKAKWKKGQ